MQVNSNEIPVVTIDGPSGSGKGTISSMLAQRLKWHFLDSGALYRIAAYHYWKNNIEYSDDTIHAVFNEIKIDFVYDKSSESYVAHLNDENVEQAIRQDTISKKASELATKPAVRVALVGCQRAFRQAPGLIADGRDMGTVIFPDAFVKIFLTASLEERANRRYKQLKELGLDVTLPTLKNQMAERDRRDIQRDSAPLKPAKDAILIDTTHLTVAAVMDQIIKLVNINN